MIYLDNNATTKIDPRVLECMMPFLTDQYANAASNHQLGVAVNQHIKTARMHVADLIGASSDEIIFTSGATEAINLALKGVAEKYQNKGKHIITVTTEHPAVLDTCKYLATIGYEITYLPVNEDGLLDIDTLKNCIRDDTILVSVMLVNNETGVIQPIKQIAEIVHEKGALFMTDATQAVGKMSIDVNELGIDLLGLSAHKFYGPKGVGALYIRSRRPNRPRLKALIHGGGHELGMRSGTLNVPGIVGLGNAAEIAKSEMNSDSKRISDIRDYMEKQFLQLNNTLVNGNTANRLYNVSNICFENADADAIIVGLKDIAVSNGSACSSSSIEPSHVLMAMGRTEAQAFSSLRFSFGRFNSKDEAKTVIDQVTKVVSELREIVV